MANTLIMPQLGESMAEGTITRWLKQEGETVQQDESLVEIATDKVNAELPAPAAGVLQKILAPEGTVVPVGGQMAVIVDPSELNRPSAPPLASQDAHWGEGTRSPRGEPASSGNGRAQREPAEGGRKRTTMLVRKIAEENNVNLEEVEGTGINGRVTRQDILNYLERRGPDGGTAPGGTAPGGAAPTTTVAPAPVTTAPARPAPVAAPAPAPQPASAAEAAPSPPPGRYDTVSLTPMRRAIAEHMIRSRRTSPHATTIFEVDMTNVMVWRETVKDRFRQREGVNLTYMPIVMQAAISGLRAFPIINSSWGGDKVYLRRDINLGFAVGLDEGLVVPVIPNADEKSLVGLAKAIDELANKAREGKLNYQDLTGGTFTVNNTGAYGSLLSIPIINQPQAAILAMEAIVRRPIVDQLGNLAIRPMMYVVLSYDHRLVDGLIAGRFLGQVKKWLEEFTAPAGEY